MSNFDPTTLEIYRALYTSVAEEMGQAFLRRTAFAAICLLKRKA
jgi:N-methylhydantoinase B/oxoprolinase/acetone carboxylase alpha subunit